MISSIALELPSRRCRSTISREVLVTLGEGGQSSRAVKETFLFLVIIGLKLLLVTGVIRYCDEPSSLGEPTPQATASRD